jgi:hypothetical protein
LSHRGDFSVFLPVLSNQQIEKSTIYAIYCQLLDSCRSTSKPPVQIPVAEAFGDCRCASTRYDPSA